MMQNIQKIIAMPRDLAWMQVAANPDKSNLQLIVQDIAHDQASTSTCRKQPACKCKLMCAVRLATSAMSRHRQKSSSQQCRRKRLIEQPLRDDSLSTEHPQAHWKWHLACICVA